MSPPSSPSAALSASAPPCVVVPSGEPALPDQWFEQEVKPHEPALRAYLHRKYPGLSDVDDVVQESFVKVFKSWQKGTLTSAKGFLFAAASNLTVDLFRRRKFTSPVPVSELPHLSVLEDNANVVESVCSQDELSLVAEAIAALPERCGQVVALRVLRGWECRDIGAELGITEATVRVHLASGMKHCTQFLRSRKNSTEEKA